MIRRAEKPEDQSVTEKKWVELGFKGIRILLNSDPNEIRIDIGELRYIHSQCLDHDAEQYFVTICLSMISYLSELAAAGIPIMTFPYRDILIAKIESTRKNLNLEYTK